MIDLGDAEEYQINQAIERLLLRQRLANKFTGNSLTTMRDVNTMLEILTAYGDCSFEDVTENADLQGKIRDGMLGHPLFLGNEGCFRAGRIYAARAPMAKAIIKTESLVYDLQAAALTLLTNTHEVALKKAVEVSIVFWQNAARQNLDTSTTKAVNVYESQVANEPNRGVQATPFTKVRLDTYGGTAAYYQKSFTDLYLPKAHEIGVDIDKVSGALFCDCWVTILTE